MSRDLTPRQPNQPSRRSLDALVRAANREHQRATGSALTAIQHAVRAGEALIKARELCDLGEWGDFIASRFQGSLRTAQRYMRLANHWRRLAQTAPEDALSSQRKAALALTSIISGEDDRLESAPAGGGRDARVASSEKTQAGGDARVASPDENQTPSDARVASATEAGGAIVVEFFQRGMRAVDRVISELRAHTPVTYHVAAAIRMVESLRAELAELASVSVERAKTSRVGE